MEHTERHRHPYSDVDLINQIFPRGLNYDKEKFARGIAARIGYNNLSDLTKGDIEEIEVQAIWPCQQMLSKTKVIGLALYLTDHDVPGYPIGIRVNDDVYLLDGHHRIAAQIIAGKKRVKIHTTDVSSETELIEEMSHPKVHNKTTITM